jgi:hypothetical protein
MTKRFKTFVDFHALMQTAVNKVVNCLLICDIIGLLIGMPVWETTWDIMGPGTA